MVDSNEFEELDNNLKQSFSGVKKDVLDLKAKLKANEERLNKLSDTVKDTESSKDIKTRLSAISKQVRNIGKEMESFDASDINAKEIKKQKEMLIAVQKKITHMNKTVTSLESELNDCREEFVTQNEYKDNLKHIDTSSREQAKLIERIEDVEARIEENLAKNMNAIDMVAQMRGEGVSKERLEKEMSSQEDYVEKRIELLRKEVEFIRTEVQEIGESISDNALSEDDVKKHVAVELKKAIEEQEKENKAMRREMHAIKEELAKEYVDGEDLDFQRDKFEKRCIEIEDMLDEIANSKSDEKEVKRLSQELSRLQAEISAFKEDMSDITISDKDVKKEVARDVKTILQQQEKELKELRGEIKNVKGELEDEFLDKDDWNKDHQALQEKIEKLNDHLSDLSHLERGVKDIDSLHDKIADVELELKEYKKEIGGSLVSENEIKNNLEIRFDEIDSRLDSLYRMKKDIKEIEGLKKEITLLKEDTVSRDEIAERIDRLRRTVSELSHVVQRRTEENQQLTKRFEKTVQTFEEEALKVEQKKRASVFSRAGNWLKEFFSEEDESAEKEKELVEREKRIKRGEKQLKKDEEIIEELRIEEEKRYEAEKEREEKPKSKREQGWISRALNTAANFFTEEEMEEVEKEVKKPAHDKKAREKGRKKKPRSRALFIIVLILALIALGAIFFVFIKPTLLPEGTLSFIYVKKPGLETNNANVSNLSTPTLPKNETKEPITSITQNKTNEQINKTNISAVNEAAAQKTGQEKSSLAKWVDEHRYMLAIIVYFIIIALLIIYVITLFKKRKKFYTWMIQFFSIESVQKKKEQEGTGTRKTIWWVIGAIVIIALFIVVYYINSPLISTNNVKNETNASLVHEEISKTEIKQIQNATNLSNNTLNETTIQENITPIVSLRNISTETNQTIIETKNKQCILTYECKQKPDGLYYFDCYYDTDSDTCRCFTGEKQDCQSEKIKELSAEGSKMFLTRIERFFFVYQYYIFAGILILALIAIIISDKRRRGQKSRSKR